MNTINLILKIMSTVLVVLSVITGVYEVVVRVVPTVKDWTIIGNIIKILNAISNALNNGVK